MGLFVITMPCPKCGHETRHFLAEVRLVEGDDDMGSAMVRCNVCGHPSSVIPSFDVVVGKRYSR